MRDTAVELRNLNIELGYKLDDQANVVAFSAGARDVCFCKVLRQVLDPSLHSVRLVPVQFRCK